MAESSPVEIPNPFPVDPFGHVNNYDYRALVHYFFPTPISTTRFQESVTELTNALPWVAWQVKPIPADGRHYLIPSDHQYVHVRDWTRTRLTRVIQSSISPGPGHPMGGWGPDDVRPVWFFQLNQLQGGSVLSCSVHHVVHDIAGITSVIGMLSKLCDGKKLSAEEINIANCRRDTLIDVSDIELPTTNMNGPKFEAVIGNFSRPDSKTLQWYAFSAPDQAIKKLKSRAQQTKPQSVPFISTDDVISAFYWQQLYRARNYPPSKHGDQTNCNRVINGRKVLGLPANYPGLVVTSTDISMSLGDILTLPLGEIAGALRESLDTTRPGNWVEKTKALVKYLQQPDIPRLDALKGFDPDYDFVGTSWRTQKMDHLTFGTGQSPDAMRMGQLSPWRGGYALMPVDADGSNVIQACLSSAELGELLENEEFCQTFKLVG